VYPLTAYMTTIGRGRLNDIQLKDDTRASRYHCRILRRGGDYYIEDNHSVSGALIDGAPITAQRL